jgi:hypothetical protein
VLVLALEEFAQVLALEEFGSVLAREVGGFGSVLEDTKRVDCMAFGPFATNKTSRRSAPAATMVLASVSRIATVTIARRKNERRVDMAAQAS